MKKILAGILALSMSIGGINVMAKAALSETVIYVSENGSNSAAGTKDAPVADIDAALSLAAAASADTTEDIVIYVQPGEYIIDKPIEITEAYNHKNGGKIIITGADDGSTVISGGEKVSDWGTHDTNIWKATVNADDIRQLWVDGNMAQRARTAGTILTAGIYDDISTETEDDGILLPASALPEDIAGAEGVEVVYDLLWTRQRLAVEEIAKNGDYISFKMKQPYYDYLLDKENKNTVPNHASNTDPNSSQQFDYCYVENAYSLLDSEGEFYFDKGTKTLYYYSENKPENTVVGVSEGMFKIEGKSADAKVRDITVKNLTMRYGTWLAPNEKGISWIQGDYVVSENGVFVMGDADNPRGERPLAQVSVKWAEDIEISDNNIEDIGSAAIDMSEGVADSAIKGNIISDTSAGAIILGDWNHVFGTENPRMCSNITVTQNKINDIAYEYASNPAISIYYAKGIDVTHNTITNTAYSGISVGWGWKSQKSAAAGGHYIANNHIENCVTVLDDGANIYTLGDLNGSIIHQNYIKKSNDLGEGIRGGIYLDEGTQNLTLTGNVSVDSSAWLNARQNKGLANITVDGNFSDAGARHPNAVSIENHTICADKDFSAYPKATAAINIAGAKKPFEGDTDINVVYLGGSITYGTGASNANASWASKIGEYLKAAYEKDGATVTNYNVGLPGTGSDMGLLRLEKDVISKDPDMVFIEFAVNDGGSKESLRNMESIILTLQKMDKIPYVVIVLTTNNSLNVNADNHKAVAKYYGIPAVDLQSIIKADQNADIAAMLSDSVHPNDTGYAYYAEKIEDVLSGGAYVRPSQRSAKLNAESNAVYGIYTEASRLEYSGFVKEGTSLVSNTEGASIEFDFVGNVLGIQDRIYTNGGDYIVEIDGQEAAARSTLYQGQNQTALGYASFDLPNGRHTLKIITKNSSQVTIEGIFTKDPAVPEDFDGGIFEKFIPYEGNVPQHTVTIPSNNPSWTDDYLGLQDMGTYWLNAFTYTSEYAEGKTNTCYALAAYPKQAGTYPGVLVLHGGGQRAQSALNEIKALAQAGYIAIAPELPGIANADITPNSSGDWKTTKWDSDYNPYAREPYQAVTAAIQALHLLQSGNVIVDGTGTKINAQVDTDKIGIEGVSWGGYTATMLAGILREQVDAVFSYYGSGFYETSSWWSDYMATMDKEKLTYWINNLDAGRWAKNITAPYFIAAATNDNFFHPPAVMSTLAEVPGTSGVLFSPNTNHQITVNGKTVNTTFAPDDMTYFDYYLKGEGAAPATVKLKNKGMTESGYEVKFEAKSDVSIASAKAYYSPHTDSWKNRVWTELDTERYENGFVSYIPESASGKQDIYLIVTDANGVSSSSVIYTVMEDAAVNYIDILDAGINKIEAEDYTSAYFTGTGVVGNVISFNWGETLDYAINIPSDGHYEIKVNNAAMSNGKGINVLVDGEMKLTGNIAVTGGYNTYALSSLGTVDLTAGKHILRLAANADLNLDYITIEKVEKTTYRLEAETNDGASVGDAATATKPATVHNSNQYITWNVNIEKAGNYEFTLNACGYNNIVRPVIKVDNAVVIECEITEYNKDKKCVQNVVGTAALTSGAHTITLYNPADGYFTDGRKSSSMFVDWLEMNRTSGITKFRLECENGDAYDSGTANGANRRTLWNDNGSVTWNNIEIEEPGMYRFTIAAEGYQKTAKPVIYVNNQAAAYSAEVLPDGQGVYEMGTYAMKAGKYSIKLVNPSDGSFADGWISANMYADYVEIERISGLTQYVLEFENADKYDYKGAKIVDNATGVSFYNAAAWAEWNVNVSGGEYEFVLKASTAVGTKSKPVLFVDDKAVVQTSYSSAESWANVDTNICRIYLEEGKHTVKMYNPQNAGTGENKDSSGKGIYESSVSTFADKLTVRKVSNMGLTTVKKAGELTVKANAKEYAGAELYIGVYNGTTLIDLYKAEGTDEITDKFTLDNGDYKVKLMLWNEMKPEETVNVY